MDSFEALKEKEWGEKMRPQPLRGKIIIPPYRSWKYGWYLAKDIRSAVEYAIKKLNKLRVRGAEGGDDLIEIDEAIEIIKKAFEDVMKGEWKDQGWKKWVKRKT